MDFASTSSLSTMLISYTTSSLLPSMSRPSLHSSIIPTYPSSTRINFPGIRRNGGRVWTLQTTVKDSSSENQTVTVTPSPTTEDAAQSASEVVRSFYEGINAHDLVTVEDLIAENCVYEDLIFPRPFVGRKAVLEFFKKFTDSISTDLQFVIDDISAEDLLAVGVTWHLEWKSKPFPFSKGCSFYRLDVVNGRRQIIYGRDSVEPAIKPGETALVAIRGVTWLLQQFPQLANQL